MLWNHLRRHYFFFLNLLIISLLLLLPYYLFQGKIFLGGDDTRLFYAYPREYLANVPLFSWINLASVGWNFSYQSFLPFVLVWSFLASIITSKIILAYFSFSLTLILGFLFFQKLISELIYEKGDKYRREIFLGSLFYILSPIIIVNHFSNPLIPIWLIGLLPATCFFFLRFVKTGSLKYILLAIIFITIFSFGVHNTPWEAGFLLPIFISFLIGSVLYKKKDVVFFIKRFAIFGLLVFLSQSFWLLGFIMNFVESPTNSFVTKAISKDVVNNFAETVRVTSSGNILYPLLNLYHRQISFDFQWGLKNIFETFYDKTYIINSIYIIILFLGIVNFKKYTNRSESKIFIILLIAFGVALYLFTVNIGPLLDLYILFGNIPGFVLFRNPFDKFALGYGLIYAMLITYCLVILRRKYEKSNKKSLLITIFFIGAVFMGIVPFKDIIVSPLGTTKNIYKNIEIPQEYFDFMANIKRHVYPTTNILSLPYGLAQYTVIKDVDSNNVYAGISPVVIFSGVNDFAGYHSFLFGAEGKIFDNAIINKQYDVLNNILFTHNINYVFITNNVPEEVKRSYLYVPNVLKAQDKKFVSAITNKKILTSAKGNYELYIAKKPNSLISSDNLTFKRVSRVKYKIKITNIKNKQELLFNDTFHPSWKLYFQPIKDELNCEKYLVIRELKTSECQPESRIFEPEDLTFLWSNPTFENTHQIKNGFSSKWVIDPEYIRNNVDKKNFRLNKDGSIDIEMVLYFKPQSYFYFGTALSILVVVILLFVTIRQK